MSAREITASEIYARSQGGLCQGDQQCHYCAAPCDRTLLHGEPMGALSGKPLTPGVRKRLSSPYCCVGCMMWRRKKTTAAFLSGGIEDGKPPCRYSWFVSTAGAWALRPPGCGPKLYQRLLNPIGWHPVRRPTAEQLEPGPQPPQKAPGWDKLPNAFFLMLREGDDAPEGTIQTCPGNVTDALDVTTRLSFTVNNVLHHYTIYELEQAAFTGPQGREPGVRALLRLFGPVPRELVRHVAADPEGEERPERGRPVQKPDPRVADLTRKVKPGKWK